MTALVARSAALRGRLEATDVAIEAGQYCALVGPNGSGKTSLLRCLAGIEPAEVSIGGEPLSTAPPARRPHLVGFMPASRDLHWPVPVRDLIALGQPSPDREAIEAMIDRFELDLVANRPADQLSTGERTRALLARALVADPAVLLLDEPFANLDPYWVLRVADILAGRARGGTAIVCALHDLALSERFDRLLVMAEGRLVLDGKPQEIAASNEFQDAFRIQPAIDGGWAIRPTADPRSSP